MLLIKLLNFIIYSVRNKKKKKMRGGEKGGRKTPKIKRSTPAWGKLFLSCGIFLHAYDYNLHRIRQKKNGIWGVSAHLKYTECYWE